jgi:phage-related protein
MPNERERKSWNWVFLGFETPAGNRITSDEINALPQDAQDELVDVLVQLQVRPHTEWAAEHFKPLEDGLSEIRFRTASHKYRIYGCFWGNQTYLMLVATDKKVSNQKDAKQLAKDRRGQLQRRKARSHPFSVKG